MLTFHQKVDTRSTAYGHPTWCPRPRVSSSDEFGVGFGGKYPEVSKDRGHFYCYALKIGKCRLADVRKFHTV